MPYHVNFTVGYPQVFYFWVNSISSMLSLHHAIWRTKMNLLACFFLFSILFAALFQSLLYEAVGRTVNPVSGAVGLLWTGNWNVCQSGVETVLCGGALQPLPYSVAPELDDVSESAVNCTNNNPNEVIAPPLKRKAGSDFHDDLDLGLKPCLPVKLRAETSSSESATTTLGTGSDNCCSEAAGEKKLLRLFFWNKRRAIITFFFFKSF